MKFRTLFLSTMSVLLFAPAAQAVVVVGGDNGWEISFDGNVNGFYVYSDRDDAPNSARTLDVHPSLGITEGTLFDDDMDVTTPDVAYDPGTVGPATVGVLQQDGRAGSTIAGNGDSTSRVRTGLLPAFFSFNVRSPEVNGLTGSARISFAPQIQNANTKNQFGAQVDLREAFFNIDGSFGTFSVGRTLSLFQRHNILTDMTLFGTGAEGGSSAGGTTLGRIGYGYVYPQFNARMSYRTPDINGFQAEIGIYDPSRICGSGVCASETDSPRWEGEATFTTAFDNGSLKLFLSGMYQNAERGAVADNPDTRADESVTSLDVDAQGIAGGVVLDFAGAQLVASAYSGEALGTVLMLDTDSLDATGSERDHDGYILQGSYTFNGTTKIGVSYGASRADETTADRAGRLAGCGAAGDRNGDEVADDYAAHSATDPTANICSNARGAQIDENSSLTIGIYHDVTSWFKVIAEYSKVEVEWHDGFDQEADVYSVGAFFLW